MISFSQLRRISLSISFSVLLAMTIAFGFMPGASWAITSSIQGIDQPNPLLATMNQAKVTTQKVEGKAQEAIGKITGDVKAQASGKTKQLKADTLEGLDNSIVSPDYQPSKKAEQADKKIIQAEKDIEVMARKGFSQKFEK